LPHRRPDELARLDLLEQPDQLAPLPFAQMARPSVPAPYQLDNPPALLRFELQQMLSSEHQYLGDGD
jgi:hypothetical protein